MFNVALSTDNRFPVLATKNGHRQDRVAPESHQALVKWRQRQTLLWDGKFCLKTCRKPWNGISGFAVYGPLHLVVCKPNAKVYKVV